jgi:excisionase family DNA binding protein
VADLFGSGRTATYDAVRRGEIPSIKIGRKLVIPTAAVRRLLELDAPAPISQ